MQRYEGLLDRLSAGPLEHVVRSPSLVVGAGQSSSSEGLLTHHGAGRLVIHIEVAGGSLQQHCCIVGELPTNNCILNIR